MTEQIADDPLIHARRMVGQAIRRLADEAEAYVTLHEMVLATAAPRNEREAMLAARMQAMDLEGYARMRESARALDEARGRQLALESKERCHG